MAAKLTPHEVVIRWDPIEEVPYIRCCCGWMQQFEGPQVTLDQANAAANRHLGQVKSRLKQGWNQPRNG